MKTFLSLKEDEQLVVDVPGWVVFWFKHQYLTNGCSVIAVYRNGWFVANHPSLSSAIIAVLRQSETECGPHWRMLTEQVFVLALAQFDIQRQTSALKLWMAADFRNNNFLSYCKDKKDSQYVNKYDILTEDCV